MNQLLTQRIDVIDSHTAGEPTRCVLSGAPEAGSGPLSQRLLRLRSDHDFYRRAILCEPRGSDVLVGAYLLEPEDSGSVAAVIFFNNAGYLGMCGHGMIGVVKTLAFLGRIQPGVHRIETPVGTVRAELLGDGRATIENVPAYRYRSNARVEVPGYGLVTGDIAWGGNWFFLVQEHEFQGAGTLSLDHVETLTAFTWAIRLALESSGLTGAGGALIDHVELFSPAHDAANDSRNFVLCPGKAYDRSPCGTGTSAKMACLAADGLLGPGQIWRQEGLLGSVFEGSIRIDGEEILPSITGSAYVTAQSTLIFDAADPFRAGIPA